MTQVHWLCRWFGHRFHAGYGLPKDNYQEVPILYRQRCAIIYAPMPELGHKQEGR